MTAPLPDLRRRCALPLLAVSVLVLGAGGRALAQPSYPSQPVRIVVPYAAGGSVDATARTLANGLAARLGTGVVVENRPGANGIIGAQAVARSTPDGHTLLFSYEGTLAIAPAIYEKIPFATLTDFAPVVNVVAARLVVAASSRAPVKTYAELREYAKTGAATYGTSGGGSTPHMFGELMRQKAGLNWSHVAYKGGGPATIDAVSGQITAVVTAVTTVLPQVQAGQLRPILVGGKARTPQLPDTPTLAELGLGELDVNSYYALLAPAGTPRAVVERLNREVNALLQSPAVRAAYDAQGLEPIGGTPEQLFEQLRADLARWKAVAVSANIRME